MPASKKKEPKRKSGAQPGNKNALRHGFYSKDFTIDESKRLDSIDPKELASEIALLKVKIDRLNQQLDLSENWISDKEGNQRRDDHYLAQLNTLSNMTTALATLKRTQYLIQGRSSSITDAIEAAMEEIRLEMGI
jgi:uncharacterized protein YjcR